MKTMYFLEDIYIGGETNYIDISGKKYDSYNGNDISLLYSEINSSAHYLKMYDDWYIINNKFYYYKYSFAFFELLMSELFKYFNLECPNYQVASNGYGFGIISENFRDKDSSYWDYKEIHIWQAKRVSSSIKGFNRFLLSFMNKDDANELINILLRLLSVDFFSGQSDRYYYNLLFRENAGLSLTPFTDNGAIFENENLNSMEYYAGSIALPKSNVISKEEKRSLKFIEENPEFKINLSKCLDIDLSLVIKNTLEKYFLEIPDNEKTEIIDYFDKKKFIIDNTLKLIK